MNIASIARTAAKLHNYSSQSARDTHTFRSSLISHCTINCTDLKHNMEPRRRRCGPIIEAACLVGCSRDIITNYINYNNY